MILPFLPVLMMNVWLIAHRGGVVDDARPENSAAALQEAIRRGYRMVETDVDESRDGRLVVHHGSFQWSYGDPNTPAALTWERIQALRARQDGSRPLEFREYAARLKGRIRIMIDTKGTSHPAGFYDSMERTLRENALLDDAWFIGLEEARRHFKGKARVSISAGGLRKALEAGEPVARLYFLFERGRKLDGETIELASRAGVPVVASINEFHYSSLHDPLQAAEADIQRLRRLGVVIFQIDSIYERFCR